MQRQGQDDSASTLLEPHEAPDDDPPTAPQRGTEPDLNRYEEDEVATVPWPPPPPPSHPHNIEA
jgi:hypothetical protein